MDSTLLNETQVFQCHVHHGKFDASSRQHAALDFLEIYVNKVDRLALSGLSSDFYAPSCKFYNTDAIIYDGGENIWNWMRSLLFAPFAKMQHNITRIWLIAPNLQVIGKEGQQILVEAEWNSWPKPEGEAAPPVVIPRILSFRVGPSEFDGTGTNGLQFLEAQCWWDTSLMAKELAKRRAGGKS
jgi:hypothetical protein